ncbi:MAG: alpha/beta hydrolase [Actinomycetota bacterium]|nr:alpha/beta hydrolase [Actinomycetota bacterium]
MNPTDFTYSSADDVTIAARRWDPSEQPRGIVQLSHGMGEHIRRYGPLAQFLIEAGFIVVGQDHRGHGATVDSPAQHGQLGAAGWSGLVDDIGRLSKVVRADHPDLPLVLLGHSMGSFAAQQYALEHSSEISALALTGTAVLDLLEPSLDLDQPMDLAMFNAPFAPARTDYDWLSRDEAQVDLYVADPQCGFGLDGLAGRQMFTGARALADQARVAAMRPDLPVYIAVGDQDPVNAQLALLSPLVERYSAALGDVTVHIYPGARHEVFNEVNRGEVFTDLLTWLNRIVT